MSAAIDVDAATAATDAAVAAGDTETIRAALTAERLERALEAAAALRRAYERNKALATECSDWAAKCVAEIERANRGGEAPPKIPASPPPLPTQDRR